MRRVIVWMFGLLLVCGFAQQASAQWWPGNGMFFPNKVPFGFYGAGVNPYLGMQGGYGPGMMSSPQPLYVQGRNNGYVNPTTGTVRGYGTTNINASYQIQPQEYYVPPPQSRQDIIPRMRAEEQQRRLQQQQQVPQQQVVPPPPEPGIGPVPNPPTAQRQNQPQPPKPNSNRYVAQQAPPQPQYMQTGVRASNR